MKKKTKEYITLLNVLIVNSNFVNFDLINMQIMKKYLNIAAFLMIAFFIANSQMLYSQNAKVLPKVTVRTYKVKISMPMNSTMTGNPL